MSPCSQPYVEKRKIENVEIFWLRYENPIGFLVSIQIPDVPNRSIDRSTSSKSYDMEPGIYKICWKKSKYGENKG